jgi:hypothetical protein
MISRLRKLPWREFWAGVALGEASLLLGIYFWYAFVR